MSVAANHQPAAPPVNGVAASFVPLEKIVPSLTNPRKNFEGEAFSELVESVVEHGVLQPILVRPCVVTLEHSAAAKAILRPIDVVFPEPGEAAYELVCGERRFRAALQGRLTDIPATVRPLTDTEAREIQIIENLQRKDVSALEEAEGFRQLLAALQAEQPDAGQKELVQTIAQKIGKSIRYVYARLALDKLVPEAKQALAEGKIEASHADLLVRLDTERQKEVYEDSLFQWDSKAEDHKGPAVSVRQLKDRIESSAQELKKAPWKWQKDATLQPSCVGCENNTASQEGADPKSARCLDEDCYARKVKAFIDVRLEELTAKTDSEPVKVCGSHYSAPKGVKSAEHWKKAPLGSCDSIVPGLLVSYGGEWENAITVCANQKCKTHFPAEPAVKQADAKRVAEEAKRKAEEERAAAADIAVFNAVLPKIKTFDATVFSLIAPILAKQGEFDDLGISAVATFFGWKISGDSHYRFLRDAAEKQAPKLTPEQQIQFLVGCVIGEAIANRYDYGFSEDKLDALAKRLGLDPKAIRDAVIKPKPDAPKAKTSAELAALPIAPGSLSTKKTPAKKSAKAATKKAAKPAKKAAKKGGRK